MTRHATIGTGVPGLDDAALQASFRGAMASVAAPVSVVTTFRDGRPFGATVSAFASLSLRPPMLVVSLDNASTVLSRLGVGSSVGVNVLGAHQDQVALRFATRGIDKFADIAWTLEDGVPVLSDCHAWVSMAVVQLVEAGDHTLVLGQVGSARTSPSRPLTYWQRTFGTHQAF